MVSIVEIRKLEELNEISGVDSLSAKLHQMLIPFEDEVSYIAKGIEYALDQSGSRGGFILVAKEENDIVGSLVMLNTNMTEYVPENLLLYVAVHESQRGKGIGTKLISKAIELCKGDVKLHVEFDNPAKRLYERIGFQSKYADMRYSNE
ncbi:MAG: GNAT family N-acetyltransferase [Candidatus Fermentibacteria bacterium]|nr:GNAT family N-acetyltransferase [Candidatus Fermentibacteria bacterium]